MTKLPLGSREACLTLAILLLAYLGFLMAFYLRVHEQRGAALFVKSGLVLAVWASAVPAWGAISARDVSSLIRAAQLGVNK